MQYPLAKMSNPYWRFALLIRRVQQQIDPCIAVQPENDEAFTSKSIRVTKS
jgi:hypothetical protein